MKKILFINACIRPDSRTYILAKEVIAKMPGLVEEVNLQQAGIRPLDGETLNERDEHVRNKDFTSSIFQYARQFADSDEIVIAAPYWDLSFPAALKIYVEAVTVCGLTFEHTKEGRPKGLCKAEKLIYVTTAGGVIPENNFGFDYIKALAQGFYGIPVVLYYKAEQLDIKGADIDKIMKEATDKIKADERLCLRKGI